MCAHTAGYVDTHHKSGAVRPGSKTDKADTGQACLPINFPLPPFFFFFLCVLRFLFRRWSFIGGQQSLNLHIPALAQAETSPTRCSSSHEEWGI